MGEYTGEIAALSTSILWSLTSTFFTIAAVKVGAVVLNRMRLIIALVFLSIMHLILQGAIFPIQASSYQLWILAISGIVGMAIGDASLYQSFIMIGTHLGMLLMSFVPIISTIIAWIFLKENLSPIKIIAILITVSGIAMVVWGKRRHSLHIPIKKYIFGILFGIGAALGQASGLALSKIGIVGKSGNIHLSGISATIIRVLSASITIWLFTILAGRFEHTKDKLKENPKSLWAIIAGSFVGPFLGMWCSMIAVKYAYIGIASTLMALPPVFLLPISHYVFKEKITIVSIVGTLIAICGAAMIFLL